MSKTIQLLSLSAVAALGIGLLGGCATDAKNIAQQALDKANAAQACCDANTERVDRMFTKSIRK